jgi:predicted small lipoprotein YifL
MNGLKALKGTAVALSLMALAGCGQSYNPGAEEHDAAPHGQGDVFGSNPDTAPYQTVNYDVLRSWLVSTLHMPVTATVGAYPANGSSPAGTCAGMQTNCPRQAPVQDLDANTGALGVAVFTVDPDGTAAPSLMSSGGFKVWILASSSACGLAMNNTTTREELFPAAMGGVSNYNQFYGALLGREPSAAEISELDLLQASFADDAHKAAAVCSTTLATLENLAAN